YGCAADGWPGSSCRRRKNGCRALVCASRNSMVLRADPGPECKSAASFPDPARCRRCGGCAETIFLFLLARRNVGSTNLPDGIRGRECGSCRDECLQFPAKSCLED